MTISEKFLQSYVHNGRIGVLVEFGLETSIPPRSERFIDFTRGVAMHIAALKPIDIPDLLGQEYIKDRSISVGNLVRNISDEISEEIEITRFVRWDTEAGPPDSEGPPPRSPAVAMKVVK